MGFWLLVMLSVVGGIVVAWISFAVGQYRGYEDGYREGKYMGERDVSNSFWKEENELPIGVPLLCLGSVKTETFYLSCIYLGREPVKVLPLVGYYVFVLTTHPFPRLFQLGVQEETPELAKAE